jgi:hypothetical protein
MTKQTVSEAAAAKKAKPAAKPVAAPRSTVRTNSSAPGLQSKSGAGAPAKPAPKKPAAKAAKP